MIVLTTSAIIGVLVFSRRYGIPIIFKYDFYCGNRGVSTLSKSIWLVFFTYLLIICKLRNVVTLLVMIVIPAWSICTKLAMTSDLMFFNTLLRLAMCSLEDSINLILFLLLIGMITCFLDGLFVVIFTLGFGFPTSLMILWILLIFLTCNLENIFLIFRILLVIGTETWVYNLLLSLFSISLVLFLKNLEISLTSLEYFAGISGGSFVKLASLSVSLLPLKGFLISWIFGMNLDTTCYLNVLLSLLVMRTSHSNLYIVEMKFQATSPILLKSNMLLALVQFMLLCLI